MTENKPAYATNKKKDPILELIKMHDLILKFIDKADEKWDSGNEHLRFLLKAEKGVLKLSRSKFDEVPQLDPLYKYFRRLLLKAQSGNRSSLYELKTYIVDLRETWIQARKVYKKNKKAA